MVSAEEKRKKMLNEPVELLVCKMAVPTIITMLISSLYNMADTYFVGQLDTVSTAAVGLALPLMNVIQAVGFFFGHGSGNYISRVLGSGDKDSAEKMGDTAVIMSLVFGTLFAVLGLVFVKPLTIVLGATPLLEELGAEYISVILIGVPFIMTSFTMNNQLRFQGNAALGMVGMTIGAVLNVVLDPIFIFTLEMGVKGAALATIISQFVSFSILLVMSGRFPFRKPKFCLNSEMVSSVFKFGTPSLLRQGITSVAAICLNHAAGGYGEAVIAAVSVVNKIVMIGASIVIGFGQGFQPVCGFNAGAGRHDRVRKTFLFCLKASTVYMFLFGVAVYALAPELVRIFRDDPLVIESGARLLRFQCFTLATHGMIIMTNMLMQNMGKTFTASFLAMARQGLFFIPLILILPRFMGLSGVESAQAVADLLTAIITAPLTARAVKELSEMAEKTQTMEVTNE